MLQLLNVLLGVKGGEPLPGFGVWPQQCQAQGTGAALGPWPHRGCSRAGAVAHPGSRPGAVSRRPGVPAPVSPSTQRGRESESASTLARTTPELSFYLETDDVEATPRHDWPRVPEGIKGGVSGRGGAFRETARQRGAAMARGALALGVLALLALLGLGAAAEAPKVEVYARSRAEEGKENILHCFVSGFHPPKIDIELLKNGQPIPGVKYGDLSFNEKWQFQRLVYVPFTPTRDDIFSCRVAHSTMPERRDYKWEPDF